MNHQIVQDAVCEPIVSLDDLLSWERDNTHFPELLQKQPFVSFDASGMRVANSNTNSRLLVCHDMKGGYIEDRFYAGHTDSAAYTFYRWPQIDEFVYFSHQFVTVPPCGWVDAAHRHGVPIYGTIITESSAGEALCRRLLASPETVDRAVDRLVAVSLHHGIDGWLVNIENAIDAQQMGMLEYLVRWLTEQMHVAVGHSRVIWYDSVISDGTLAWQNELNEKNERFFWSCDGIFLNYTWSPAGLVRSRERAGSARRADVYVGADMFGRGCPGGGGFNVVLPVAEARYLGLSAAVFAPGWTHEVLGPGRFPVAEDVVWSRLAPLVGTRGPTRLPLVTSFCQGRGLRRYRDGKIVSGGPWHRLSDQQLQPSYLQREQLADLALTDAMGYPVEAAVFLRTPAALGHHADADRSADLCRSAEQARIEAVCAGGLRPPQPGWEVHHTVQDGFIGGSCLSVTNRTATDALFRLFNCDLPVSGGRLSAVCAVKAADGGDPTSWRRCAVCLDIADSASAQAKICRLALVLDSAAPEDWLSPLKEGADSLQRHRPSPADQVQERLARPLAGPGHCGWQTRHYLLPVPAGYERGQVRSVAVSLPAAGSVLLGYLAVHEA